MHDNLKTLIEMRDGLSEHIRIYGGWDTAKQKRERDALSWAIKILEHVDLLSEI
jgi:hypothetical protein